MTKQIALTRETEEIRDALPTMMIYEIARLICDDWQKVYFGAVPYLDAMKFIEKITDNYMNDSAKTIVAYFLCNAGTWKGPIAQLVKAELRKRIK